MLVRGGADTDGPIAAAKRSLARWHAAAPATHALAHASLVSFVASHRPALRRWLQGHAVCCRRALARGRVHAVLAHALVVSEPMGLLFSLYALGFLARPLEERLGSRKFATLAVGGVLGGAAAATAAQFAARAENLSIGPRLAESATRRYLGARGGVTGLGGLVFAAGAVAVLERPNRPVAVLVLPQTFPAKRVGQAFLAFDALLTACGHPGAAAHLGGAAAGCAFFRAGALARPRSRPPPYAYGLPAAPPPAPPAVGFPPGPPTGPPERLFGS